MNDLRLQIETAFSGATYPGDDRLTACACDECQEICDYFKCGNWRGHSIDQLRNVETALFHLTPEGFRFFLPAFLLAVVEDPGQAQAIPDLVVWNLRPDKTDLAIDRVNALSGEQCNAVVRFLDYVVESGIEEYSEVEPARDLLDARRRSL